MHTASHPWLSNPTRLFVVLLSSAQILYGANRPPPAPQLLSPEQNASGLDPQSIAIKWAFIADPDADPLESYVVIRESGASWEPHFPGAVGKATSYTVSNFRPNTTFEVMVAAVDWGMHSNPWYTWSSVRTFSTKSAISLGVAASRTYALSSQAWTRIDNPFNSSIGLSLARFLYQKESVTLEEAVNRGWLYAVCFEWVNGGWQSFQLASGAFRPQQSYWVWAFVSGANLLLFDGTEADALSSKLRFPLDGTYARERITGYNFGSHWEGLYCVNHAPAHPLRHTGIDIHARAGDHVYAVQEGIIKVLKWDPDGWVAIEHPNRTTSIYEHVMPRGSLAEGSAVSKGAWIADIGATRAPHLHFQFRDVPYHNITLDIVGRIPDGKGCITPTREGGTRMGDPQFLGDFLDPKTLDWEQ